MAALARLTYLRAWSVLGSAFIVLSLAAVGSADVFDRVQPFDISDPGSEVAQASTAVEMLTGRSADPGVVLLVAQGGGPAEAARSLASVPGVARVASPASNPDLVSPEGTRSIVLGYLESGAGRVEVGEAVADRFAEAPGISAGGTAVAAFQVGVRSENDSRRIELMAAPVLLILLLIVFRTIVAALLPLIVAGLTILITFASLRLITELTPIDLFSLQVVTGLGVGLAIDYSLFIIARYREEMLIGTGYELAHTRTLQTAGRTVAFSSLTVAGALGALAVFPQPFLHSTAIAGALTAIFAGIIALLVLPAALAILGPSVNRFAIRRDPRQSGRATHAGPWQRLPRAVCRRPVAAILGGGLVMLALASQSLGGGFTTPDARELPSSDSARVVAESLSDFPAVSPTTLFAVVPIPGTDLADVRANLERVDEVTRISAPMALDRGSVEVAIYAAVDPLSDQAQDLVARARGELPAGSLLGGRAAELADQRSSISSHAPLAITLIFVTNLLFLIAMTRSLVLPFLALALNVLTVAASLGAMTAAFTAGWTADLLGTAVQEGIDISVPVLAFAVAFGLSTDYGIFLLARIREERPTARDEQEAIIAGVATTGRLITASALLLAIAVGAFALSDLVIIKEFAITIAIAVLIDATIVRGLLIPGSLRLLGRRAWWPRAERTAG